MRFRFDDGELDVDRAELRVHGKVVRVEPQVFDVLAVLLRHHGRLVTKEELLDEVWHHRFVTESALSSRIKSARRAIGDDGTAQRLIRTAHGRGYQFVGAVHVEENGSAARVPALAAEGRVPRPATRTIGRDGDIEAVRSLFETARIVTLLGPGGVGKTRLAIEVALHLSSTSGVDGAFVDLTKVRDADLVAGLVARELGMHSGSAGDAVHVLQEGLRRRSLLLILDNFEHVVDAAGLVSDLATWAPDLRLLVTSRARLRIAGEHVYDVAPLVVDDDERGAIALFAQAATAVDPAFELDRHSADVRTICRTVDGLPLAIELAASHVRTLPPALLRTRLGTLLGAPAAGARDAPTRQRTIPAMIDWSLALLGRPEQVLFARLGVFAGPVDLDAIEHVCGAGDLDVLTSLARLVDQSLVRRGPDVDGRPRFLLLELLHERARELLAASGDETPMRDRHLAYVTDVVEDVERRRWGEACATWIDATGDLLGEIRSAHAWAVESGDVDRAARITASMGTFWHREGHHAEGRRWVAHALVHGNALDLRTVAHVELAAGFVAWARDRHEAGRHWDRAIGMFRQLGDDRYLAYALALSSGRYIGDRDRYEEGMARSTEAIRLARVVGDPPLIAQALNVRGEISRVHGDDEVAQEDYVEGERLSSAVGDRAHQTIFLANLAYLAAHRGEYEEARGLAGEALRMCWSMGRRMMAAWTVSELAGPELGLGRPERGAWLVGAAEEALRVQGASRHPGDVPEHDRVVADLRAALGDRFDRLLAEGAGLSLEQAVALALSESTDLCDVTAGS